ncbi:efflux RND transporter periplasmic adaptor subunit [candidate division KSB1 bacterium]|nr:efflux RND transporter periplasmic adaptor subunit [candidate division KSB1 bacterium]
MKKLILLLIILIFFLACNRQDSNVDLQIAIPVSVEEIKYKPIEEFVTATGTVYAIQEVDLKAETPGFYRLAENKTTGRPFTLGEQIKKGEIIIYLDNPELENSIKIESQKLNLDISEREFEKQKSLYEKGGVTLRELKNAEISFIDAQYNYESALLQLAKTKVIAPFDGIIIDLPYHTEGTRVTTDSRMVQLMNYKRLYSEFNLPGKDLPQIKADQRVRVMNYSVPDDTLWGKVTQVAPAFDPDSRSFKTSIEVDNSQMIFRPGMFIKAEIIVAHEDSAIVIPKDIILAQGDEKWVYTVVKGAADRRRITTGIENPLEVQVLEGLKVEERLVVKGFETLQRNSKVKIIR